MTEQDDRYAAELERKAEDWETARMKGHDEPRCAKLGCSYPAPLGTYCGLHTGEELAETRQARKNAAKRKIKL